jgi:hypothetical protein
MTIKSFNLKNFNSENRYKQYFIELNEETYVFIVRWIGDYFNGFAELTITDYDDNPIITGRALVNGLKIRTHNLPHIMYFVQQAGETYEPTLDNIADEFIFLYNDEVII